MTHTLALQNEQGVDIGMLTLTTQMVRLPAEPEFNFDLNRNCVLRLWISGCSKLSASNQPTTAVHISYDGATLKTRQAQGGGQEPEWGEVFELNNVFQQVRLEEFLLLSTDNGFSA